MPLPIATLGNYIWRALCRYDFEGLKHVGIACKYECLNKHSTSWATETVYCTSSKMNFKGIQQTDRNNEETGRALVRDK